MKRLIAIGTATLLAGAAQAQSAAQPAPPAPNPRLAQAVADLQAALPKQDCPVIMTAARTLLELAPNAPAQGKSMLYALIAGCEFDAKKLDDAYRDALLATEGPDTIDPAWVTRVDIEYETKKYDALLTTLEMLADKRPLALGAVDADYLSQLHRILDNAGNHALDMRLLKLMSLSYVSDDAFADVDGLRVRYARKLMIEGKTEEARTVVNLVVRFDALMDVALDKALRPLRKAPIDLLAVANRQLLDDQSALAAHPESMAGVATVAADLNRLGKYQAALDALDSVRAHINDPKAFADQWKTTNWWWNGRARAYYLLGDYPHVVESYRGAIAAGERGGANVSQLLNLAGAQIDFGHYADALETLSNATEEKSRSAFGNMVYHEMHGCAAFMTGKKDLAAADIAYLRTHEKDGPGPARSMWVCMDDMAAVESSLLRQLDDPEQRGSALETLSDFKPEPAGAPRWPGHDKVQQLKAHLALKAAIEKAGGTLTFPFRSGEL